MSAFLVHHFLERSAQARPDATLVVARDTNRTFGETEREANRIARLLQDQGVAPGDRVALLAANSPTYIESYYGILKAGAIAVSLNAQGDRRGLLEVLRDCSPRGLLCGPREARRAAPLGPDAGLEFVFSPDGPLPAEEPGSCRFLHGRDVLRSFPDSSPGVGGTDLDRAAIVYTSGSTGKPRGAILRHLNVVSNTRSIVSYLELGPTDRVLVVLPFHYVYGKSLLNTHVAAGGSVVLENRFLYPQEALNTLERAEATGLSGVPSTFAILLNKSNLAERELPSLRYVTQAGGAMAPELQRRLIAALPGKRVFIMYGATEASARLSYLPPGDLSRKLGSIGIPIPNVDLRILRNDGTEAGVDEVGEIVARGSNIMEGYWGDPEETAAVLDHDGYHTGDLGRRDPEGYLYVVGRKREMIKSGAHRLSPKEIEETLAGNPAIHEVAVVGVPDEMLGEAIAACVSLRPDADADPDSLTRWCRERLPVYKVPHVFRIWADMPRNASGKPDKPAMRRALESERAP